MGRRRLSRRHRGPAYQRHRGGSGLATCPPGDRSGAARRDRSAPVGHDRRRHQPCRVPRYRNAHGVGDVPDRPPTVRGDRLGRPERVRVVRVAALDPRRVRRRTRRPPPGVADRCTTGVSRRHTGRDHRGMGERPRVRRRRGGGCRSPRRLLDDLVDRRHRRHRFAVARRSAPALHRLAGRQIGRWHRRRRRIGQVARRRGRLAQRAHGRR